MNGIGGWAIVDKQSDEFVGWGGLKLVKEPTNKHVNFYEKAYRFKRKYWRQGMAAESALASLAYGFKVLDLTEIFAAAYVDNTGSNKILLNCRMKFIKTLYFDEATLCNWYRISNNDWKRACLL